MGPSDWPKIGWVKIVGFSTYALYLQHWASVVMKSGVQSMCFLPLDASRLIGKVTPSSRTGIPRMRMSIPTLVQNSPNSFGHRERLDLNPTYPHLAKASEPTWEKSSSRWLGAFKT